MPLWESQLSEKQATVNQNDVKLDSGLLAKSFFFTFVGTIRTYMG